MYGVNDVPVGLAYTKRSDGPFTGGVINRYGAVIQEYLQIFLLVYTVLQTLPCVFGNDRIRVNRFYP